MCVSKVSIPGNVIPKTLKIVLDTALLNTRQCKIHIAGNGHGDMSSNPERD